MGESSPPAWLRESDNRTVFEGDVLGVDHDGKHTLTFSAGVGTSTRGQTPG